MLIAADGSQQPRETVMKIIQIIIILKPKKRTAVSLACEALS